MRDKAEPFAVWANAVPIIFRRVVAFSHVVVDDEKLLAIALRSIVNVLGIGCESRTSQNDFEVWTFFAVNHDQFFSVLFQREKISLLIGAGRTVFRRRRRRPWTERCFFNFELAFTRRRI